MKIRVTIIFILSTILMFGSAANQNSETIEPMQTEIMVNISGFVFSPNSLTLTAGDQVTFTVSNADGASHTFTIRDSEGNEELDIVVTGGGSDSGVWTVPSDGDTYDFFCRFHPSMTGTITIEDGDVSSDTTSSQSQNTNTTTSQSENTNTTSSESISSSSMANTSENDQSSDSTDEQSPLTIIGLTSLAVIPKIRRKLLSQDKIH